MMHSATRRVLLRQLRADTSRLAGRAMASQAQSHSIGSERHAFLATVAVTALGLTAMSLPDQKQQRAAMEKAAAVRKVTTDDQIHPNNYPPPRPDLPTFTMEEVAEHADEDSLWYTFR